VKSLKWNLKNCPRHGPKIVEWIEGFEAELREIIEEIQQDTSCPTNIEIALTKLIREILGE